MSEVTPLHLIELYEYKVADMLERREPRGGKQSVRELRDLLTNSRLDGNLIRRFRVADRNLREKSAVPTSNMQVIEATGLEVGLGFDGFTMSAPQLEINDVAPAAVAPEVFDEEGLVLRQLGMQLWRADMSEELLEQGKKWRSESNRSVLRLVYALLHNLDQYAEQPTFPTDLNLSKFKVVSPVPEPNDSLIRLSDSEAVDGLMHSLLHHILDFSKEYPKLRLPETEVLPYLRRFAMAVANDHLAGEPPPAIQPSPREINSAIDQVRRENMNPEAKNEMLARLNKQLEQAAAKEREQAQSLQNERRALLTAVEALFAYVVERIPARFGGKEKDVTPPAQVLNAQNDSRRLETVPTDAQQIVIRLSRATELEMGNEKLLLTNRPEGWVIALKEAEYPLRNSNVIPLEKREIQVFSDTSGAVPYVLLQLRDRDGGGLWNLLSLARCTALLLDPSYSFLNMRLMRATVSWIRDRRIEPREFHPEVGATYATAPEDNLLKFARTASERILERLRRSPAGTLEKGFTTAAEVLSEDESPIRASLLAQVYAEAMAHQVGEFTEGTELHKANEVIVVSYRGEPLTVRVMGRAFTIRTDNLGKMYAFAPGAGGRAFEDVLAIIVPGGFVIFARDGLRVAVGFLAVQ